MTSILSNQELNAIIAGRFPGALAESNDRIVILKADHLLEVAQYLKSDPNLSFDYLNFITATDYYDYFELVYQVSSISFNRALVLKVRCYNREKPSVPSVVSVWRGADFQEREIFDLIGIDFVGHPNMRHIFLWEGFEGYPLRKDYLLK